jgi:hypothetical protein
LPEAVTLYRIFIHKESPVTQEGKKLLLVKETLFHYHFDKNPQFYYLELEDFKSSPFRSCLGRVNLVSDPPLLRKFDTS